MKLLLTILLVGILISTPIHPISAQEQEVLYINEFFPNPDGADTDLEWLELFNPGSADIKLREFILKVNGKNLHVFEEDEVVKAGSYFLVPFTKAPLPNCGNQPCTAKIELFKAGNLVHEVVYDKTANGKSWSRKDDNTWTLDYEVTPGLQNKSREIIKTIQITEVYAAPNSGETEWLEIVNYGDKDIELEGWYLTDKTAKTKLIGVIPANSYFVLEELSISLNNSDEFISLFAPDDAKVDEFSYQTSVKGTSIIRVGANAVITTKVTPASANNYVPIEIDDEEEDIVKPSIPVTQKAQPQIVPINYLSPENSIHLLPDFITHRQIEIKANVFGMYLILLAVLLCWRSGYVRRYYDWWVTG